MKCFLKLGASVLTKKDVGSFSSMVIDKSPAVAWALTLTSFLTPRRDAEDPAGRYGLPQTSPPA